MMFFNRTNRTDPSISQSHRGVYQSVHTSRRLRSRWKFNFVQGACFNQRRKYSSLQIDFVYKVPPPWQSSGEGKGRYVREIVDTWNTIPRRWIHGMRFQGEG